MHSKFRKKRDAKAQLQQRTGSKLPMTSQLNDYVVLYNCYNLTFTEMWIQINLYRYRLTNKYRLKRVQNGEVQTLHTYNLQMHQNPHKNIN